jgi:hypothetical protein
MARAATVSIVTVALVACGDRGELMPADGGGQQAGDAAGMDAGGGSDASADAGIPDMAAPADATAAGSDAGPDGATPSARFRTIYETILVPRCGGTDGFGRGCHVTNVPDGMLGMPDVFSAYANLVNQRVVCKGHPALTGTQFRVVPFDLEKSVILRANGDGPCGVRHGSFYLDNRGYTAADQAALEAWIREGAL